MTEEQWKYWISPMALSLIAEESQASFPKETGGILIGWLEENIFHIEKAIGPGPKAIHKRNSFIRDGNFSQTRLDQIVIETAGRWDYLGEWHSHPRKMGPSFKDINSLIKIQTDPAYNICLPILGLSILIEGNWTYHCYMLNHGNQSRWFYQAVVAAN